MQKRYAVINLLFLTAYLIEAVLSSACDQRGTSKLRMCENKIDQAWDFKAEIIYDKEKDTPYQGKTTNGSEERNDESFLGADEVLFSERTSKMDDAPCFENNSKIQIEIKDNSLPSIPKIAAIEEEAKDLDDILVQIITISEIFQPSEDDLADRILSQNKEPFNINFDIDEGNFMIDFDILPDDNRGQFIASSNFSCVQLNNDIKVSIEKGEVLKILSSDGNNNLFGYIIDPLETKEPLLIPMEKVAPILKDFPASAKRKYEIPSWANFGGRNESKREILNNQIPNQKAATLKICKDKAKCLLEPEVSLDRGKSADVESIAFLQMDFNTHPMSISLANDIHQIMPNLKILSGQQGDLVCVTKKVNKYSWMEAYLMKDPNKQLGLVHANLFMNCNLT